MDATPLDAPWLRTYPPGMRWDAELPTWPLPQLLSQAAARWPDQVALDFMGREISYRELDRLADRAARGLQRLGVGPGVHVGLFLPNTPHYVIAFFGVLRAGGVVVNYSPLDASAVLAHKVEDSRTELMITLDVDALYAPMAALLGHSGLRTLVVGSVADFGGGAPAERAGEGEISLAALLDNDGRYLPYALPALDEALAVLQYTGGTTGTPKGAMLTHANLSTAVSQLRVTCGGHPPVVREGCECVLVTLPLFHIYALTVDMLLGLALGARLVLHLRFEPEAALHDIQAKRVTIFPGVPTMFTALINHPGVDRYDLRSLRFCGSGGAPLPAEVHRRFQQLSGCPLVEGWGMTETSPNGTFTPVHGPRKDGSCGLPVPGATVRIADLDDPSRSVPPGHKGELCIQGPNVTRGYWNQPAATAEAIDAEGFLHTGDIATMDDEGFVTIVDRSKDMILCGGFNVYPRLIEEAIMRHAGVAEVCVIGVPDDYRGQSPKAFVCLQPGAAEFSLEGLQEFLRPWLGKHEMVRELEFRASLPKTPVGKLSKQALVQEEQRRRSEATS